MWIHQSALTEARSSLLCLDDRERSTSWPLIRQPLQGLNFTGYSRKYGFLMFSVVQYLRLKNWYLYYMTHKSLVTWNPKRAYRLGTSRPLADSSMFWWVQMVWGITTNPPSSGVVVTCPKHFRCPVNASSWLARFAFPAAPKYWCYWLLLSDGKISIFWWAIP